jgi:hypothetical protein
MWTSVRLLGWVVCPAARDAIEAVAQRRREQAIGDLSGLGSVAVAAPAG